MPHSAGRHARWPSANQKTLAKETPREVLSGTAWLLFPMSLLPWFIYALIRIDPAFPCGRYCDWGVYAVMLTWAAGSLLLPFTRWIGRSLVTFSILSTLALGGLDKDAFITRPVLLLAIIITVMLLLSRLWLFHDLHLLSAHYARSSEVKRVGRNSRLATLGALLVVLAHWTLNLSKNDPAYETAMLAVYSAAAVANLALFVALVRIARRHIWRLLWIVISVFIALIVWTQSHLNMHVLVLVSLIPALSGVFVLPRGVTPSGQQIDWWEPIVREPNRLFALIFVILSLVATFFLSLPIAAQPGQRLHLIDALFMGVSAVCVTGLATINPHMDLSIVGQIVFIVAAQLGGLGVMTFSLATVGLLRQRVSLRVETVVAGLLSAGDRRTIRRALRLVLTYTFGIEAIGALILGFRYWRDGMPIGSAIGHGTFAAVSAFNNVGHVLTGGNLLPYAQDPEVILTIAMLVVLGGCSPFLILALIGWRQRRRISTSHRLAFLMTLALLAIGWIGFLAFEWQRTMQDFYWPHKITNAFFQSASVRTAGFTTVDLGLAHPATIVMFMVLMVIGGNPGGTAGGIKTTTAALLILAVVAAIRGHKHVRIGYRILSHAAVYRAAATASVMAAAIFGFSMLMLLTQALAPRELIFEVVSALTTTGHSLGATENLDTVGKAIIIACMFIGRVGMLTLFMFLSSRELVGTWQLAEEDVDLG